jgi:AcrR family transcriptional regulator
MHKEKDQRQQIVETAERLFREIGFQKTTVADIARELRMSPANIYRFYIGDRKLHDMVEVALNEQWPIVEQHIERIATCLARIIADGMASGEFAPGDPVLATKLVHTACMRFCLPTDGRMRRQNRADHRSDGGLLPRGAAGEGIESFILIEGELRK